MKISLSVRITLLIVFLFTFLVIGLSVMKHDSVVRLWVKNIGQSKSSYDFIYTFESNYFANGRSPYQIVDGKLVHIATTTPMIGYFDTLSEEGRVISLEEAGSLHLSSEVLSPDGYVFVAEHTPCGDGAACRELYLRNMSLGVERMIVLPEYDLIGGAQFVAWVLP
jgi:hypothetical protein